jgi:hypothetical protein
LNFEANVWSLMLDLGEIDGGGGGNEIEMLVEFF